MQGHENNLKQDKDVNDMVRELSGLYAAGMFRVWKIKFPYKTSGTFVFFGSKTDASAAAAKLQKSLKHPYAPKITEITKSYA